MWLLRKIHSTNIRRLQDVINTTDVLNYRIFQGTWKANKTAVYWTKEIAPPLVTNIHFGSPTTLLNPSFLSQTKV